MERNQFTFYRSYYEALKHLPKRDRADVLMAIIGYALDQAEPSLSGVPLSVFTLVRPTLDSGRNKALNRKNKTKTNQEQNGKEKEIEKEIEIECEGENDSYNPLPPSFVSEALKYYMNRVNATPSSTCISEIVEYEKQIGTEVCKKAVDVALDEKKTGWSYIRAILRDKAQKGIKTLAQWQEDEDSTRKQRETAYSTAKEKRAGVLPGHRPSPETDERAKASMERLRQRMKQEGTP